MNKDKRAKRAKQKAKDMRHARQKRQQIKIPKYIEKHHGDGTVTKIPNPEYLKEH